MAKYRVTCGKCGAALTYSDKLVGQTRQCPKCGDLLSLDGSRPVEEPVGDAAAQEAPAPRAAVGERFPERMKANKALAGRKCPACGHDIELGDDVYNCQVCGMTTHQMCSSAAGGCGDQDCPSNKAALGVAPEPGGVSGPTPAAEAGTVPCKFCGEPILPNAIKCRHCGEFQNEAMRQKRSGGSPEDDTLSAGEIVFGIICGGIACIVGIVWGLMGKKKGWKLMAIGIVSSVVGSLIRVMIEALANR